MWRRVGSLLGRSQRRFVPALNFALPSRSVPLVLVSSSLLGSSLIGRDSVSCSDDAEVDEVAKTEADEVAKVLALSTSVLSDTKIALLATVAHHGDALQPRGRMVQVFPSETLDVVWVCSNDATRKMAEIQTNPHVAICAWHQDSMSHVEISGRASLLPRPQAESRFPEDWLLFYPDGPKSPRFCCIEVAVDRIEVVSIGYGVGCGEDPKDWHPPTAVVRNAKDGQWVLEHPSEHRLKALRGE